MTSEIQTREKQAVERERTREGVFFRPDVDILERADEYVLTADLPGVDERNVDVRLEEDRLSIVGNLAVEPGADWTELYAEYRLGGFQREFALSDRIDAEKISARMHDGVLELHLPKAGRHRPRQIEVRSG